MKLNLHLNAKRNLFATARIVQRFHLRNRLFIIAFLFLCTRAGAQVSFSSVALPTGMEYTPSNAGVMHVADINNDGYPDIIYNTSVGGAITYLQNNGGTSFSTPATNPFSAFTSSTPTGTIFNVGSNFADFDNDGDLDFWGRVNGAGNDVYLRNDAGTYVSASLITGMEFTIANTSNVHVVDINEDGLLDIVFNALPGSGITYLQNNGGSSFSTPVVNPFTNFVASTPTGTTLGVAPSCFADFDGDGDLDFWCRVGGAANDIYLQNDNGTYVSATIIPGLEFTPAGTGAVVVADFNGDGLPDYVYNSVAGGAITYVQNNGGTTFSTPASNNPFASFTASAPGGGLFNSAASFADVDRDGDLDLWSRLNGAGNDMLLIASGAAPAFTATTPVHTASSVSVTSNIVLQFSETVSTGTGSFYIRRSSDNVAIATIAANSSNVTGSGTNTITIDPDGYLPSGTTYYVTFDRTALADADGVIPGHINLQYRSRIPERTSAFLSFTTAGLLPVQLTTFSAERANGNSLLKWQTEGESNSRDFIIQHRTNGNSWNTIGTVAAAGNSSTTLQYQFTHHHPEAGINYYRLLQTDLDGRTQYSPIRLVRNSSDDEPVLYPNPAQSNAFLQFPNAAITTITIYAMDGRQVYRGLQNGSLISLDLSKLASGTYTLVLLRNNKQYQRTLIRK